MNEIVQKYSFKRISSSDVPALVEFFQRQPEESFQFFTPHGFDSESILQFVNCPSNIVYVKEEDGKILAYGFLRCFFLGNAYLGKMVDFNHYGQGYGTQIVSIGSEICQRVNLTMYVSLNLANPASMATSKHVCNVTIMKNISQDYILIKDTPKPSSQS